MRNDIETVVFDLDGTIYQNTVFHHDYLHFLVEGTCYECWQQKLVEFAEQVYAGKRLHMNSFYTLKRLNCQTPEAFFSALEQCLCPPLTYRQALETQGLLYLGDAWAVVILIGKALGLLEGGRNEAVFRRTRRKMEQDGIQGCPELALAIQALARRHSVVLLSNSYQDTVKEFLKQLGMEHTFPLLCCSANKPADMICNLHRALPGTAARPQTVVSIGDNAFNDLMPVAELGGRTVWMNPYPNIRRPHCDVELRTLQELCAYLAGL